MHNRNNLLEEKGLFTFYLEQQSQQQNLKKQKSLKKIRQTQNEQPDSPAKSPKKGKRKQMVRPSQQNLKAYLSEEKSMMSKGKSNHSKERLRESIIQMGKDTNLSHPQTIHKPTLNPLRFRQHSFISKITHSGKDYGIHLSNSQQNVHYYPQHTIEEFNQHSFRRHKMTQKVNSAYIKEPIQNQRDFFIELPEIRKTQDVKSTSRPKKSMKSKLIQEALHTGDRVRIQQIRQYLRGESPMKSLQRRLEEQSASKSLKVFELRHQKLLNILQRFK